MDEYTTEAVIFHQKFKVAPGKLTGWKRLTGQEVPIEGVSGLLSIAGTSPWNAEALATVAGAPALAAPRNAVETARRLGQILNGAQTPKATQPNLDMWIPLL